MITDNDKEYFTRLRNKIFRLLPIYEGKDKESGDIIYDPEVACINFLGNLVTVVTEIKGLQATRQDLQVNDLLLLLEGMRNAKVGEHSEVKTNVFAAIRWCKRIGEIE